MANQLAHRSHAFGYSEGQHDLRVPTKGQHPAQVYAYRGFIHGWAIFQPCSLRCDSGFTFSPNDQSNQICRISPINAFALQKWRMQGHMLNVRGCKGKIFLLKIHSCGSSWNMPSRFQMWWRCMIVNAQKLVRFDSLKWEANLTYPAESPQFSSALHATPSAVRYFIASRRVFSNFPKGPLRSGGDRIKTSEFRS